MTIVVWNSKYNRNLLADEFALCGSVIKILNVHQRERAGENTIASRDFFM